MGLPSTALGHQVGFEAQRAGPPTHVYIGQEDWASVTAYNAVAGATFSVFLRILTPQGIVVPFEDDYSPAATRAAVTNDRPLTEGYLLSATVRTTSAVKRGQLYCQLQLRRNGPPAGVLYHTFISDYVHLGYAPFWPAATQRGPTEGPGILRSFNVPNPAAGADWAQAVPTGARWRLVSLQATLSTSVVVANRNPGLVFDDGANIFWSAPSQRISAASSALAYSWGNQGVVALTTASTGSGDTMPPEYLFAGFRVRATTVALQAADQWSGINLLVEEWIEP